MKRIISMFVCLVMIALTLTGCSTLQGDDKGAIINVFFGTRIIDFDPSKNYHDNDMVKFYSMIYEGLTRLDENGNWEKALMKSYEKDFDDEKGEYSVTIQLNSTQWSDGRSVQAQDVVFAWKRIIECTNQNAAAAMLFDVKNARACKYGDASIDDLGVIAEDTYVLKINFEYAVDLDEFFRTCASTALVPLREDIVARNPDWAKKTSSICTNGPFAVKEIDYKETKYVRLERNANYYLDDEKDEALDKYVTPWRVVTNYKYGELSDQLAAFENEEIFYLGELPIESREEYAPYATVNNELSTHAYYFNTKNELFSDARVRRALSLAIDRQAIADMLVFADPATGLIPFGVQDTSVSSDFRKTADAEGNVINTSADLDTAKDLLKKAGVKKGQEITITLKKDNESDEAVAKYIADVWTDLGFKVKLNALGVKVTTDEETNNNIVIDYFADALAAGEFDVIAIDSQMLSRDAFSALAPYATKFSGGGVDMDSENYDFIGNIAGYENPEYSELIEKAYAEHDKAARAALLHEAEKLLMEDVPVMPVVFNKTAYVYNSRVISGIKDTYWGGVDFTRVKMKDYMTYKKQILGENF